MKMQLADRLLGVLEKNPRCCIELALNVQRLPEVTRLPTPLSTPSPVDTTLPASPGASPSAVPPSRDQVPLVVVVAVLERY